MNFISRVLIILTLFVLAGCRAKPAPETEFLDEPKLLTTQDKDAAFQRAYWDPTFKYDNYTELWVAPTNMHYMLTQSFWEKANEVNMGPEQVKMSADQIAEYTRNAFIKAAQNDPKKRLKVVEVVGPKTIVLETAIVQLVPSKAVLNALGYISWIPNAVAAGSSALTKSEDQGKGVVAIEARLRDGSTGKVVGMFADREHPPQAIVDIKSLNWWAPAKKIIDNWAAQFVATANNPKGKVKSKPNFELLVW